MTSLEVVDLSAYVGVGVYVGVVCVCVAGSLVAGSLIVVLVLAL